MTLVVIKGVALHAQLAGLFQSPSKAPVHEPSGLTLIVTVKFAPTQLPSEADDVGVTV